MKSQNTTLISFALSAILLLSVNAAVETISVVNTTKPISTTTTSNLRTVSSTILSSSLPQNTKIDGNYDLTPLGLSLTISQNLYSLKGCNTHSFTFTTSTGNQVSFGSFASTSNSCDIDFDRYYLQAFELGRYLTTVGSGFRVLDENSKILLDIVFSGSSGVFVVNFPSVQLTVTGNSFAFEGCNIITADCEISGNKIQLGKVGSTRRECLFNDYDEYILETFGLANTFEISSTGLILRSNGNALTIGFPRSGSSPIQVIPTNNITIPVKNPTVIKVPQISTPVVIPTPIYTPPFIPIPVPVTPSLPSISSFSLKGVYRLELLSSSLTNIIVNFDDSYLNFEGCNVQRIPYAAYSDGIFCLLQGGSSTFRQCIIDNDAEYISVLSRVNRYVKNVDGFVLMSDNEVVGNLVVRIRNQVVNYNVINGGYEFQIPGLEVSVTDGRISFQGCNSVSIPFTLSNTGSITFGAAISTKIFCKNDVDQYYVQSITASTELRQVKEGFVLVDRNGFERIRFTSLSLEQPYYDSFNGRYQIFLPNAGIRFVADNGVFRLSGCNVYSLKFNLADSGVLVLGTANLNGTETKCDLDFDKVFLYSLLKASSIAVFDQSIIFISGNKEIVGKAISYDAPANYDETVAFIDPNSPVVTVRDFNFIEGSYKLTLLRSSLKALNLTVSRGLISFKGCNSVSFSYVATSNGKVSFTQGISTEIACRENYDSFFISAILSISAFEVTKGLYTFFDSNGKSVISWTADVSISGLIVVPVPVPVNPTPVTPTPVHPTPITPIHPNLPTKPTDSSNLPPNFFNPTDDQTPFFFDGRFTFQIPKIVFSIENNSLLFRGCNTHRIPFTSNNNRGVLCGKPVSTKSVSTCSSTDVDSFFLNVINTISSFTFSNGRFTFYNNRYQSLFTAQTSGVVTGRLTSGTYTATIPSINISFDNQRIIFDGCKGNEFTYNAKKSGFINFIKGSGQNTCQLGYDSIFSNSVASSSRFIENSQGFVLQDNYGNQRATCFRN